MKNNYLRIGEKNNFNFTDKEFKTLEKYRAKYHCFVNSNSKVTVQGDLPSIVTLNPDLKFQPLPIDSDFSNIKAFRVKVFYGMTDWNTMVEYAESHNIPILVTFMRFKDGRSLAKYTDNYANCYEWKQNWYRLKSENKKASIAVLRIVHNNIYFCDEAGKGCPACLNCIRLTYGAESGEISALNLSVSGIKDKNGKQGLCPFSCPDCWSKFVCFGNSPACDKVIKNRKLTGDLVIKK
jgi:hypothetical protein